MDKTNIHFYYKREILSLVTIQWNLQNIILGTEWKYLHNKLIEVEQDNGYQRGNGVDRKSEMLNRHEFQLRKMNSSDLLHRIVANK